MKFIHNIWSQIKKGTEKSAYHPRFYSYIFIAALVGLFFFFDYISILPLKPQSLHLWRQTDCLAISMTYYQGEMDFFNPAMLNLGDDGTGKTISDFPIVSYTVAGIWKLFGHSEFAYRALILALVLIGLFYLYKTIEDILKDSFLAMFSALILFSSTMFVYYSANFLNNIAALSLVFIAWYFFIKFIRSKNILHLWLFCLLILLAGLLKVTATFSFIALCAIYLLERLGWINQNKSDKLFQQSVKALIPIMSVFLVIFLWIVYARHYNEKYNSGAFLIGILPMWNISSAEIKDTFKQINYHIHNDYFYPFLQYVFGFIIISLIIFSRRISRPLLLFTLFSLIGFGLYIILFFQPIKAHDYYVTNFLFLIPLLFLALFSLIKNMHQPTFLSPVLRISLIVLFILSISHSKEKVNGRYTGWQNVDWEYHNSALSEIDPYLTDMGIKPDDKILCLSDRTINASLYYMNRKGWTAYGDPVIEKETIEKRLRQGARYIVVYDTITSNNKIVKPYLKNRVGRFENIYIYRTSINDSLKVNDEPEITTTNVEN